MSYLHTILTRYAFSNASFPKTSSDFLISQIPIVQFMLRTILTPYPKVEQIFDSEVTTMHQTKFHAENLQDHLIACGLICSHVASDFYDAIPELAQICTKETFANMCLQAGLYHDIGKPFARNNVGKRSIYIGHAQLGARFLEETNTCSDAVVWTVDHHMCYCCHRHIGDFSKTHYAIESLMFDVNIDIKKALLRFAILACLAFADLFAREDETFDYNYETTFKYSVDLFNKLHRQKQSLYLNQYQKYVIHMFGLSGSGKSHTVNLFKTTFQDNFCVHAISRDECLEHVFCDLSKADKLLTNREMYEYVANHAEGKKKVQQEWIRRLNYALTFETSDQQIIIIDTCQTMYPRAWNDTIASLDEDARAEYVTVMKIGYLTIPWHYFNNEYVMKTGEYLQLPIQNNAFWPHSASETETLETNSMHWTTGSHVQLIQLMNNLINVRNETFDCDVQQEMLQTLLNKIHEPQSDNFVQTCKQLNQYLAVDFISYKIEIENEQAALITFGYQDGLQQFNLATRDYRGEGILFDKQHKIFMMLRPALPVFAEMASIHHDHRALSYLVPNLNKIFDQDHYIHRVCHNIPKKSVQKYLITPKYDGSLFNLTFISCQHELFDIMIKLIRDNEQCILSTAYFESPIGLFLIGSKGTCLSKNPVNSRIHRSIIGSHGSFNNFIINAMQCVINLKAQHATLHFEAIDIVPTPELTVIYDCSKCVFFGATVFDGEKRYLLSNQIKHSFRDASSTYECETFDQVLEFYNHNYNLMFDEYGSTVIEPEGFVLHLVTDGQIISIKYKFDLYYVAHKPTSIKNTTKAKIIMHDERYTHIRKRLMKFAVQRTISEILNSIDFETEVHVLLTHFNKPCTKKDWAMHWKSNSNIFDKLLMFAHETLVKNRVIITNPINSFSFVMKMFDAKLNRFEFKVTDTCLNK